jgi:hypothetical protein
MLRVEVPPRSKAKYAIMLTILVDATLVDE